jgi:hypothetical protein
MPVSVLNSYHDPEGRYTRVDYVWEEQEYSSICVYAPASPKERQTFFEKSLSSFFVTIPLLDNTFIAGDWNFVSDPSLDRRSANLSGGQVEKTEFAELLRCFDLSDLFLHYHPSKRAFTFSSLQHNMSTRLDRCYFTKKALPFTGDCKHVPLPSSVFDHEAGVSFTGRAINKTARGDSY